jgi:hypothetical protein
MNQQQPAKKPGEIQLRAKIDEKVAEGVYVNLANVMHNQSEFVIDFGRVVPGRQDFTVHSRIIISPFHARQLLEALKRNIGQYEKNVGEIKGAAGSDERKVGF